MAGKRAEPSPPGGPEIETSAERGPPRRPPERFGPLEVLRTGKDDGRALILYTRSEDGA